MRTTARERRDSSIFVCSATARSRIIETSFVAQIDAVLGEELLDHAIDEALVEIVAAEERVAGGAEHLVDLIVRA